MSKIKVLVEVDGVKVLDYEDDVSSVHVSHTTGLREQPLTSDYEFVDYETDGTHHVVLSYKE